MSIFHNNMLGGAAGQAGGAAGPIQSVRFNPGDSAHLTRSNPNEGSQRKFTFSFWVKRKQPGRGASNVDKAIFFAGPSPDSAKGLDIRFDSNDRLYVETYANSSTSKKVITHRVFRDPAAWYHIVLAFDTTQSTENDRLIIYVNGEQVNTSDLSSSNHVVQNFDYRYVGESNADHWIGLAKDNNGTKRFYFDGYLTDFYFIDGAQKDETDFGEFDDNGVWQAIAYDGTYGSNGYHLFDFANESTVGHDSSSNGDDWTANNISSTAGAGNDILFDVPVNGTQSDTGAGGEVSGNYCVMNPLIVDQTNAITSNGNLHVKYPNTAESWLGNLQGTNYITFVGTMGLTSGKWYFEAVETVRETSTESMVVGVVDTPMGGVYHIGSVGNGIGYKRIEVKNGLGSSIVTTSSMPDFSVGDVVGVALDLDNGKIYFSVNGTYINSGNPAAGTGFLASGLSGTFFPAISRWSRRHSIEADLNFGQRPFNTSAPSGFKAICTANLPDPTIADGSDYFDTALWNGTGSSQPITGLEFEPDFLWGKRRNQAGDHILIDSVRGEDKILHSNDYPAEDTDSSILTSFNSNGFTVGTNVGLNSSGVKIVGWAWDAGSSNPVSNTDGDVTSSVKANTNAGFSIVKWNPSSNEQSVGHGLNAVPEFIMAKALDNGHSWRVYHKDLTSGKNLLLDQRDREDAYTDRIDTVNSTVFDGNRGLTGSSLNNNIAYCFTSVEGYSAFGSYEGNNNSRGPFIWLGFRPAWIMYKAINENTAAADWFIRDYKRLGFNHATDSQNNPELEANENNGENNNGPIDILSNGFLIKSNNPGHNTDGEKYMYAAFAENPFKANGGLAR